MQIKPLVIVAVSLLGITEAIVIGKAGKRQLDPDDFDDIDDINPDEIPLPPACPQQCLATALAETVQSRACQADDWVCLCKNEDYLTNSITCFNNLCSKEDAEDGLVYGIEFCDAVGVNVTISPTVTVTTGLVLPTLTV
ncbi:hypothetical protein BT69DRAFT_1300433 [Atractiella rhizophila]|nr:hypothetical protein BT69DRAFT_1300433 [Atractiella rhizophila]